MNKNIPTVITVSALAIVLGACVPERSVSHKSPGSYERTETSTDDRGTTTVKKSTVDVTVDEHGNRKETITSKTVRDPKGLMNKTTTKKTSETIEER